MPVCSLVRRCWLAQAFGNGQLSFDLGARALKSDALRFISMPYALWHRIYIVILRHFAPKFVSGIDFQRQMSFRSFSAGGFQWIVSTHKKNGTSPISIEYGQGGVLFEDQ